MNIAFPAILLLFLVLPGILARKFYLSQDTKVKTFRFEAYATELAYGIIFAMALHSLWYFFSYLLEYYIGSNSYFQFCIDYKSILILLYGSFNTENGITHDILNSITSHKLEIFIYFSSMYAFVYTVPKFLPYHPSDPWFRIFRSPNIEYQSIIEDNLEEFATYFKEVFELKKISNDIRAYLGYLKKVSLNSNDKEQLLFQIKLLLNILFGLSEKSKRFRICFSIFKKLNVFNMQNVINRLHSFVRGYIIREILSFYKIKIDGVKVSIYMEDELEKFKINGILNEYFLTEKGEGLTKFIIKNTEKETLYRKNDLSGYITDDDVDGDIGLIVKYDNINQLGINYIYAIEEKTPGVFSLLKNIISNSFNVWFLWRLILSQFLQQLYYQLYHYLRRNPKV